MNGISADLPLEDAIGVCGMLVRFERAIPPGQWVDYLIEANEYGMLNAAF